MALPKGIGNAATEKLNKLFEKDPENALQKWPDVTKDDYAIFGQYIVLFSYIDLNLRRVVESAAKAGIVKETKTKARDLKIDKVETAIQTLPKWPDANKKAMGQIRRYRTGRNLIAHFAVKRFPSDDAYVFITKCADDFRDVFKEEPQHDTLMHGVIEAKAIRSALKNVSDLQRWMAIVAHELCGRFEKGVLHAGP